MKIRTWIEKLDPNIVLIGGGMLSLLFTLMFLIHKENIAKYKAQTPIIQHVGVPIYLTNTVFLIIPTNSIPLTNVITAPTSKSN